MDFFGRTCCHEVTKKNCHTQDSSKISPNMQLMYPDSLTSPFGFPWPTDPERHGETRLPDVLLNETPSESDPIYPFVLHSKLPMAEPTI